MFAKFGTSANLHVWVYDANGNKTDGYYLSALHSRTTIIKPEGKLVEAVDIGLSEGMTRTYSELKTIKSLCLM